MKNLILVFEVVKTILMGIKYVLRTKRAKEIKEGGESAENGDQRKLEEVESGSSVAVEPDKYHGMYERTTTKKE